MEANILRVLSKSTEEAEKIIKGSIEDNCAIIMAKSGARASMTHLIQLSAFTGQARILGERVHRGFRDRSTRLLKE